MAKQTDNVACTTTLLLALGLLPKMRAVAQKCIAVTVVDEHGDEAHRAADE
jgi:hypothetical protein